MANTVKVEGVQDPYINHFELWEVEKEELRTGDRVPSVGMAETYAVQYAATEKASPIFLWVQDNKITNVMAMQPIGQRSVFDQKGRYLGQGGYKLDPIEIEQPDPVDLVSAVKQNKAKVQMPLEKASEKSQRSVTESSDNFADPSGEALQTSDSELIDDMLMELEQECPPDSKSLVHRFHLRPDLELEISLPMDLTEREAERLATFILSCPFWRED